MTNKSEPDSAPSEPLDVWLALLDACFAAGDGPVGARDHAVLRLLMSIIAGRIDELSPSAVRSVAEAKTKALSAEELFGRGLGCGQFCLCRILS